MSTRIRHRAMKRAMAWAGAVVFVVTVSACAATPHQEGEMLGGTHVMPNKGGVMSNQAMPSGSIDCSEAALANMPPEHRQACQRTGQPTQR
jgi:hypothetical protein